jgi:serine palmitoyltransferase
VPCTVPQEAWAIIGPGGRLHPGWFLEHKGHLVVEGLLIVIIAVMLLQSRFSPKATEDEEGLTDKVSSCAPFSTTGS